MGMIGIFRQIDDERLKTAKSGENQLEYIELDGLESEDIDKTWHAIFDTLKADDSEEAKYVVPMTDECVLPFDEADFPFGVFGISSDKVKTTADYLKNLDFAKFYDFDKLLEWGTYPIMDNDISEEFLEYIEMNLAGLKAFFKSASENEKAIVFYII